MVFPVLSWSVSLILVLLLAESEHGAGTQTFKERSPLGEIDEICRRYQCNRERLAQRDPQAGSYRLKKERFATYLPATEPMGILVWLSPTPRGDLWLSRVEEVLEEKRVAFVAAHNAGNRRPIWDRLGLALDAAASLGARFGTDKPVWVGGYSGGGRAASHLAWLYPEVFAGGVFGFGCDSPWSIASEKDPSRGYRAAFPVPSAIEVLRDERRFVLVTGTRDFNYGECRAIHERMQLEGFAHAAFLEVRGADHSLGLEPQWLAKALSVLMGHSGDSEQE